MNAQLLIMVFLYSIASVQKQGLANFNLLQIAAAIAEQNGKPYTGKRCAPN